jgi:hypothetical protein
VARIKVNGEVVPEKIKYRFLVKFPIEKILLTL